MYDVIIIGGGPAGLAAGIYSARARLNTLLVEKGIPGGLTITADLIENYPGFPDGINGMELMDRFKRQGQKFGVQIVRAEIKSVVPSKDLIEAQTDKGDFSGYSLIVASGSIPKKLNVPGEEKFRGKGVSYCATCDGPLFKDRDVVVVGGGDTAIEEALFLARFTRKVIIVHRRGCLRAAKILQERAEANPKIDFVWESAVADILGKGKLEGVKVENVKTAKMSVLACHGLFISVGTRPNTKFLEGIVDMDEEGYIITDDNMKTSCDGVYACGDARKKLLRQIATACGEGATAAVAAQHHVEELKGTAYR